MLVKVALDPQSACHLIDLGDRRLPQQWAQKIFHILLQGLGEDNKSSPVRKLSPVEDSHPFSPGRVTVTP